MKRRTTNTTLPPDLINEIFLWLPVKPLLRFRCVSKTLCSLIDSLDFIKQHLERSTETETNRKLIIHEHRPYNIPGWERPKDIYAIDFDKEPQEPRELNHPFKEIRMHTTIYGSCNGLLLLLIKKRLAIWNPFTRQCKKLPLCPLCGEGQIYCAFGLGYDYASDDYKVVKISGIANLNRVWVFSLKSNSWRILPDFPYTDYSISISSSGGFFANSALHWLLLKKMDHMDYGNSSEMTIAFDLANETFCMVLQPVYSPQPVFIYDSKIHLHVLEGCLCISKMNYAERDFEQYEYENFVLYVRENYGMGFTWRKLYTTLQRELDLQPLAYSKKGNKVWLTYKCYCSEIICYDLHERKTDKRVEININGLRRRTNLSVVCWESLVELGDGSEFDGDISWDSDDDSE
ncbi:F-box protein CPR1 [Jatropha curcas]|uniref:F-box protein CPR1 n=1 Tax=Jatropha curcas TaxID=180498 RepID=UPI0009D711E2|nr:F-box protein CPR1 [Jatropha curcas]